MPVLESLKKNSGYDGAVFVDKVMMSETATSVQKPDNERIVGSYQNVEATNWKAIRPMVTADLLNEAKDVAVRIKTVDGVDYGLVAVPLLDFKGKRIGAVVAIKSFEDYQSLQTSALVRAMGFAFLQALLLSGAMLILINVLFIHPQIAAASAAGEKKNS